MVHKWSVLINIPWIPINNLFLDIVGWYLHKYQLGEMFAGGKSISSLMSFILLKVGVGISD